MKQVIALRKDLNMRKGKMCAQAAHATIGSLFKTDVIISTQYNLSMTISQWQADWLQSGMKKVVVGVDSLQELIDLVADAKARYIPVYTVTDAGLTEFNEPTVTCAAFGPAPDEDVNTITAHLTLL